MGAIVEAYLDLTDRRSRRPVTLLDAAADETSGRIGTDAVRITQSGRQDFDLIRRGQPQDALLS